MTTSKMTSIFVRGEQVLNFLGDVSAAHVFLGSKARNEQKVYLALKKQKRADETVSP